MFDFFSKSKEYDLIINIGSGNVSGAILELRQSVKPKIVCFHSFSFMVGKDLKSERLENHMLGAMQRVVSILTHEFKKKIKKTHIIFSSPWFLPFSKLVEIKKDQPFAVSQKIIQKLITEEITGAIKTSVDNDSTLIENAISHIKLNGYETRNPYSKLAKTVDVSLYASTVPIKIRKKIESELYRMIHPASIEFHTFPFVAWNSVVSLFNPKEDFLLINVGGEVSDILITRRGAISASLSFPIGINHILRKTALYFESEIEFAHSMLNLYSTDSAETGLKNKIQSLISAFGEEWILHFEQSVKKAESSDQESFLPQKVFLITKSNFIKIFNDVICKRTQNIVAPDPESLSQFLEFSNGNIPNTLIAISAIYLNSILIPGGFVYKQESFFVK